MATANIYVTYTIDLPEVDVIYDGDPDLIDEKLNELKDEISNDPFYFIERFGYDMSGEVILQKGLFQMESEELKKVKLELVSKFNEYVKLGGVVYTSIEEEFEGQLTQNSYDFSIAALSNDGVYLMAEY